MVPETAPQPDAAAIRADLEHMTRRWGELEVPVMIELRALKLGSFAETARFAPDMLDMAVDWAVAKNNEDRNIYPVRNPTHATLKARYNSKGEWVEEPRYAADQDIVAAFFHWADADDAEAAESIRGFVGPKPTWVVLTGTQPCARPHAYWELEEPTYNLEAWTATQAAIAQTLRTDPAVINPSRIMRLAGTVTYPDGRKRAKGYISEITTAHVYDLGERPPVTSERMARAFQSAAPATTSASTPGVFEINLGHNSKTAADYADALRRARTDGEKHTGVRDLTASLAGAGVPRALCEAMVREACPVWDDGVEKLIETAYAKFYKQPEPPAAQQMQREADQGEDWPTPLLDFDETALPLRRWIYGTDYIRKYVSVVASAGGVGKTSQAIVEAMAIVTGKPLLGVEVKEQCNVWVVNLEDPREELLMRALAARKHYGISPDLLRGKLFLDGEDTIQVTLAAETRDGVLKNDALLDAIAARIEQHNIGAVIFDPFVSTHLVNENSNASVQSVVAMFRDLARRTEASISLVHHTRKGNGEDATIDSVRGAGSLIGAARAARVVNRLSDTQAEQLGLSAKDARSIFRVDDGKPNLAPPAESALYRQMVSVQLDNGEWVGVCAPYELPDEWAGMTDDVVNDMLNLIRKGPARNDDSEEYYSIRPQDKSRWVGSVITDYPFAKAEHFKCTAQAKTIVKQWLEKGLLEEVEYYSAAQRKDRKGVTAIGRVGEQK